jgi:hypothetical protein
MAARPWLPGLAIIDGHDTAIDREAVDLPVNQHITPLYSTLKCKLSLRPYSSGHQFLPHLSEQARVANLPTDRIESHGLLLNELILCQKPILPPAAHVAAHHP